MPRYDDLLAWLGRAHRADAIVARALRHERFWIDTHLELMHLHLEDVL